MALVLPFVHVDRRKRLITGARTGVLTKKDRSLLLSLDWDLARSDAVVGDRMVPLADDRWAVGRGDPTGTLWRIVDLPDLAQVEHPAWLWTEDDWFRRGGQGPVPRTVPLKRAMRQAARMTKSTRRMADLIAATVAHLRRPDDRPLAIVGDPHLMGSPGHASRWFGLTVVSCLPPEMGLGLSIGCLEPLPDRNLFDLVLTADPPEGFRVIEAADPPTDLGDDLVAWYIRRRLLDGDPELVEAIAPLWDQSADDPWEACLEQQIVTAGAAGISLDRDTLVNHFPVAHKLVLARLRAQAPITGRFANEIAAVTYKSGDPALWEQIARYDETSRKRVFQAWLASASRFPPTDPLLDAIGEARPPGAGTTAWLELLLDWLAEDELTDATARWIARTLEQEPTSPDLPSRAATWVEMCVGLVRSDRPQQAMGALLTPLAQGLAEAGSARSLAHAWTLLPPQHRTEGSLDDVLQVIGRGEDAGHAVRFLWSYLHAEKRTAAADHLLERWASYRAKHPTSHGDAFMDRLLGTRHAETWIRTVVAEAEHRNLPELLTPVIPPRRPELWDFAELAWTRAFQPVPRERFLGMAAFLPEGAPVLEDRAKAILAECLAATPFPDPDIAEVASLFAEAPEPSPVWMWAAVAAAAPDQFDEATVDATIHAYCGAPPRGRDERQLGRLLAKRLGFANALAPMDHARWVVRLLLAPDGDATGYNRSLAHALLQSILERSDGMDRVITIARAIFELPPDHEALRFFIQDVLPRLWKNGPPEAFMRAVQVHKQPTEIRSAWRQAFGTL